MNGLLIGVPLGLAFLILLRWMLRPQDGKSGTGSLPLDRGVEGLLPVHYRYFPQILQALSASDERYLQERAPAHVARQTLAERRAIARQFLAGLLEDFTNLERLARTIAALSPTISREQETERLILGVKFRLFYALAWLRFSTGRVPVRPIENLARLVGQFATRMEEAMAAVGALSDERLPTHLSA